MALVAAAGCASTSSAAAPSCGLVSASVIKSVLGVTVGPLKATTSHGETYCSYSVGGVPDALHVVFDLNTKRPAFDATSASAPFPGKKTIAGVGDAAYTYSLGSGTFGTTTLSLIKGTTELTITAASTLAKEKTLARRLLPSL